MPRLDAAASALVDGNIGVSVSVFVDGRRRYGAAWGARNDGLPIDTRSPFVIASVSKLFTSLAVARLVADGRIGLDDPVPWTAMGIAHDSTWSTVTVRELLTHGSGMPVARASWLDLPGPCTVPLVDAMATPPTATRGTWRYSNGNYCALGLLVEHLTGTDLAAATAALVFAPASVIGPTLSWAGERPDAAPYPKGVARLDRLGGAGAWLASTDAVAAVLSTVDATDRTSMPWPAVMVDQYGWGHTGTVDGAKACAWVIGEAVLVAVVAGDRPSTGGRICDRLVPAVAGDLGLGDLGPPVRSPA
jgi:D-alanyl-D-alanine carboxypeptidase